LSHLAATRSPPSPLRPLPVVQHRKPARVNPDASRFSDAHEIVGNAQHEPGVRGGYFDSVVRPRATSADGPTQRMRRRNKSAHDRSACRGTPACGSLRIEKSERARASSVAERPTSHRQTNTKRAILRSRCARHGGGHDIRMGLAGLPGVVPGFLLGLTDRVLRKQPDALAGKPYHACRASNFTQTAAPELRAFGPPLTLRVRRRMMTLNSRL
jgi:hypothetical protein